MIGRLIWTLAKAGLAAMLITMSGVYAAETIAASQNAAGRVPNDAYDAVIVLGGGMDPDVSLNYVGRTRADLAAWALFSGKAKAAIFTGALVGYDGPESEAFLMRQRALGAGVSVDQLYVEPQATTTLENLRFAFAMGDAQGFTRYAIVTDAFHLPRAMALASLLGRDVGGIAATGVRDLGGFHRVGYMLREAMAWWYNLGKAAAWTVLGTAGWSEAEIGEVVR
ncbi:MAG: YdcF family protein [Pseudomonadota bacterium]